MKTKTFDELVSDGVFSVVNGELRQGSGDEISIDEGTSLVIPETITSLGNSDVIINLLSPASNIDTIVVKNSNITSTEGTYPFSYAVNADVVYDGSNVSAPWGAKELNGEEVQYTPEYTTSDTLSLNISGDPEETPDSTDLIVHVKPKIVSNDFDVTNYEVSNVSVVDSNTQDITSKFTDCVNFYVDGHVVDFDNAFTFISKSGSIVDGTQIMPDTVELDGSVTITIRNKNDSSDTITLDSFDMSLIQDTSTIPVPSGDPVDSCTYDSSATEYTVQITNNSGSAATAELMFTCNQTVYGISCGPNSGTLVDDTHASLPYKDTDTGELVVVQNGASATVRYIMIDPYDQDVVSSATVVWTPVS